MKNENSFNLELGKKLRVMHPNLYHVKISDRFSIGLSDFIIWYKGRSLALESKFTAELGKGTSKLLTHPFSGAQTTFLESIALTSNNAVGTVYIKETKLWYVIPQHLIPKDGNWTVDEFLNSNFMTYSLWDGLPEMVETWV